MRHQIPLPIYLFLSLIAPDSRAARGGGSLPEPQRLPRGVVGLVAPHNKPPGVVEQQQNYSLKNIFCQVYVTTIYYFAFPRPAQKAV